MNQINMLSLIGGIRLTKEPNSTSFHNMIGCQSPSHLLSGEECDLHLLALKNRDMKKIVIIEAVRAEI